MDVISLVITRIRLEDVGEESVWLDDEWLDSVGSTISPLREPSQLGSRLPPRCLPWPAVPA